MPVCGELIVTACLGLCDTIMPMFTFSRIDTQAGQKELNRQALWQHSKAAARYRDSGDDPN